MRRTSFSRLSLAMILASVLALPMAVPANADSPAFGSGAGIAEDDGGYYGSGHKDGVIGSGTKSGFMGSGSKDGGSITTSGGKEGGTIVTSGGLRAWTRQIRSLARLAIFTWAGV